MEYSCFRSCRREKKYSKSLLAVMEIGNKHQPDGQLGSNTDLEVDLMYSICNIRTKSNSESSTVCFFAVLQA